MAWLTWPLGLCFQVRLRRVPNTEPTTRPMQSLWQWRREWKPEWPRNRKSSSWSGRFNLHPCNTITLEIAWYRANALAPNAARQSGEAAERRRHQLLSVLAAFGGMNRNLGMRDTGNFRCRHWHRHRRIGVNTDTDTGVDTGIDTGNDTSLTP